jgi:L-ascorbate metabolism protein UlaG (beta-lactamase superfamily)
MKLTKFKHSAFTLTKDDAVLVIDPGAWSTDFVVPEQVVAVVVTHEHFDHLDPEKLRAIVDKNPQAIIYGPASVTNQLQDLPNYSVVADDIVQAGPFTLTFTGGVHATIHKNFHPEFQNVGVIVDDGIVYHPGDSLALPGRPIKILSLPIIAPWEKASESMDFLAEIKPEFAFPTHDAFLNENGIELYDRWHVQMAEKIGTTYTRIVGSIDI